MFSSESRLQAAKLIVFNGAMVAFAMAWLWPIRPSPWSSFYQELCAFAGVAMLGAYGVPRLIRCSGPLVGILAVILVPLIQLLFGVILFSGDAWINTIYLFAFFVATLVGYNLSLESDQKKQLLLIFSCTVLVVAVLSAIIGIRQWLGLADSIFEIHYQGARPYANFTQPNHFATLLLLGMVSLIYCYERYLLGRFSSSAIGILLLVALVLTQSRTSWVIGVCIFLFWAWQGTRMARRLPSTVLLFWLLIYFVLVFLFPYLSDLLLLSSQSHEQRVNSAARFDIWHLALSAVSEKPWLGYGWGQTISAQLALVEEIPVKGLMTYSHNLFLDLLIWNGVVIGGLIIAGLVVWQIRLIISRLHLEAVFALLIVGVIFVHSMFEYPNAYAYFLLPAGLMLGIAEGERSNGFTLKAPLWVRTTFTVMTFVLMILVVKEYRHYEINDLNRRIAGAGVIGFEQQDFDGHFKILTQLDALQSLRNLEVTSEMSAPDLAYMKRVTSRYPHLANLYRYALALFLNKRDEEGKFQLELIKTLYGEKMYSLAVSQIGERVEGVENY